MKFGIFLPLQCPRPWSADSESRLVAEALAQAELADRLGYDYVWTQEHHFLEEYSHASAPEVLLGAISQRTSRIRLGHGVMLMLPAYNHPARCAERIAMLDLVSGGRVDWGMGASSSEAELGAFGVDPAHKHAMWEEGARTAIRILTEQPFKGVDGTYVKMPPRNLVPRSVQKPHPPLWMACANRQTMRHAARMGLGALTFAFIDPDEARHWVDEYYDVFESTCRPLGAAVNPNVAMLSNFACHPDRAEARRRGVEGAAFFAYGLGHYFRGGGHVPGETDLWAGFQRRGPDPYLEHDRFNTPAGLAEHFAVLEEAGVDQVILLQQAGGYQHEHIVESMTLFARDALPAFKARDAAREAAKHERLAPAMARAQAIIDGGDTAAPVAATTASTDDAGRRTLLDDLAWHARHRAGEPALRELDPAGFTRRELRYDALHEAVMRRAATIAARIVPGAAVLVVGDSGIDTVVSLLAAMRAGGVAVPAPAPTPGRGVERLLAIVRAAGPSLAIGLRDHLATLREDLDAQARAALQWLAVDEPDAMSLPAALPELDPTAQALLQFTSGSTSSPKGAAHTHAALRASVANAATLFGYRADDRLLTFLPVYHTLALTVHLAAAIHVGGCGCTLEPFAFAQSPAVWLAALSRHRITVSAAPNFAYARCAQLPEAAVPPGLDLSAWRLAMNAGEPPQAEVIDAFCARWQAHGFHADAMSPSYGMTEAAGPVSGRVAGAGVRRLQVDASALRAGRLAAGAPGPVLVSNGGVVPGLELVVVRPDDGQACDEGEIGELCLRGVTVVSAYVGSEASQAGRFLSLGGVRWLRTGDLGARLDGELYLTGRRHDLIIVRGENFFPDDIEQAVRGACPRPGFVGAAAIGVPADGTDTLLLVIEADGEPAQLRADAQAAREAVARQLGVRATRVVFVAPGRMPRTPIGKLRRADTRALWLDGGLAVVAEFADDAGPAATAVSSPSAADSSRDVLARELAALWCRKLQCDEVPADRSFFELGGDSLLAVETLHAINVRYGVDFALSETVRDFTITRLVQRLLEPRRAEARTCGLAADPRPDGLALRPLRDADVEPVTDLLIDACLRVPLYASVWRDREPVRERMRVLAMRAAQEGLSQVIVDEATQAIVAANLSGARDARLAVPGSVGDPVADDALVALELDLTRRLLATGCELEAPVLLLDWLAVDRRYEGRNLGPRLLEANLRAAEDKGFVTAVSHPSSLVTQHTLQREYGFVCAARQVSREFEFEGRRPFAALPPTESMCLMVRSLRADPRG